MLAWIISSGVSVVSVLLIRRIFKGKISLRLQYALWLLVLVRLLIPVNIIDTDLSILNFLTQAQAVGGISDLGGAAGGSARSSQDAFMQNLLKRGTMGGISETMPYERLAEGKTGQQSDESLIWSEEALLGRDISSLRPDIPEVQDDKAAGMGLWEKILIGIWILGMAVSAAVIAGVNLGFAHRLRRARKAADIREIEFFRADNGLPVYIVPGLPGPCLFGLLHPAIYLPEGIKQDQLPYVLAHEESHYRLGDHVWSLLRSICLALHWYHPLVWLAVYVSCQDSELACDVGGRKQKRLWPGAAGYDCGTGAQSGFSLLCHNHDGGRQKPEGEDTDDRFQAQDAGCDRCGSGGAYAGHILRGLYGS